MGLEIKYIEGQTPIDEDEKEGLLVKTISNKAELDEFEQKNIQQAIEWTLKNRFSKDEILSEKFLLHVHRMMFSDVWEWAGTKRKTNKNIGVDKHQISVELKKLIDDCKYWIEHGTFSPDEIAIRFSCRLVSIHVFPNGNGRHSRLIADILISNVFGQAVFSWGKSELSKKGATRSTYLEAVVKADQGLYQPMIDFART